MSSYKTDVGFASYFVPKECLRDDAWEYKTLQDYQTCERKRASVTAWIVTIIAVVLAVIVGGLALARQSYTTVGVTAAIASVVVLFAWLSVGFSMKKAERIWLQVESEKDALRELYPELDDQQLRAKLREEKRADRMLYAVERAGSGRAGTAAATGVLGGLAGYGIGKAV